MLQRTYISDRPIQWIYSVGSALLLLLAITTPLASAQDVKVVALVNETTIGAEERLTYTVEIQGASIPDIQPPSAPETQGLSLANQFPSRQQNLSIVNGVTTSSLSYTWIFVPVAEGKAVIGRTTVVAGGKEFKTDEVRVNVVPQASRPVRTPTRRRTIFDPPVARNAPAPAAIEKKDIFITAAPSKRNVFQNEQISIEYSLHFRQDIQLRQSRLADSWDAEGFWREELEVESRPVPRTEVKNGVRYNVIVLKRVAVFPTRSGELALDPLKIESEASVGRDRLDSFFGRGSRYQPVELSSPRIRVNAKPHPPNAPASFSGAVGTYKLTATIDRTELNVGESAQITVTVSGSGNLATLDGPAVDIPGVFEVYDPQISTSIRRKGSTARGQKTFTHILVPRTNGTYEIPPIEFSFLNPRTGRYETLTEGGYTLAVTGDASAAVAAIATTDGLPVDDIPPIITESTTWNRTRDKPIHRSAIVYVLLLLPILSIAGVLAHNAFSEKLESDVKFARNRQANPFARKHLKNAAALLEAGDSKGYYQELERAVLGFVGNRLNIGERALTRKDLDATLQKQGITQDARAQLHALLNECDLVQFAPVPPNAKAMQTAHERASDLIESLNTQLSKKESN